MLRLHTDGAPFAFSLSITVDESSADGGKYCKATNEGVCGARWDFVHVRSCSCRFFSHVPLHVIARRGPQAMGRRR